jgi:hypothetical protein
MKKMTLLFAFVPFLLGASAGGAQDAAAPPAPRAADRQFVGDVVSTDVPGNNLTVKAVAVDAQGNSVERTLTLAVDEALSARLATLKAGDKVTVLWRRDEARQRDLVVALEKAAPPPPEKS